jgi:hypothetical protein
MNDALAIGIFCWDKRQDLGKVRQVAGSVPDFLLV